MSCEKTNTKFVITKAVDNVFIFTIKKDASTLPIEIAPTDTFKATLRTLDTGDAVLTKNLVVENALSGRVRLEISASDTEVLESARGSAEDRYYIKPMYSVLLECDTQANGAFLARIGAVYVD